jgi:hypothetical protein
MMRTWLGLLVIGSVALWYSRVANLGEEHQSPDEIATPMQDKLIPTSNIAELDQILRDLRSSDEGTREGANERLMLLFIRGNRVPTAQGVTVLREVAKPFPPGRPRPEEIADKLMGLIAYDPRPEYLPVIVELFAELPAKARTRVLDIVAQFETREAAVTYMDLLRKHGKAGPIVKLGMGSLPGKPRYPDIFFPEILEYGARTNSTYDVSLLCLKYAEAGAFKGATLTSCTTKILSDYRAVAAQLIPA